MRPTNQLEQWEWMEAYHRGTLSADERLIFEQELKRDPDFSRECAQLLAADKALRELALAKTVRNAVRAELAAPPKPIQRLRLGRGRLASVLVACVLLVISYLTFSQVDLESYRQDVTLTQRYRESEDDVAGPDLTPQQRTFYREFFDAQAYLANGQPQLAIGNLEKLARVDSLRPYFKQAVQWHLLNAYLLNRQPDNADATFQLLDQSGQSVYPISTSDRWKVWWQIRWQKLGRSA
ncbi:MULTISPECIES: hypothetical protein [Spirosoma]|uniref:Uncharacterized protein n=1 Tax=Spirosoma sordidisoli TaxID=2502893 RepID=A0A4Q2UDG8_9BACT|nr:MULTISPECIES: hypothetical protein [Spirosoma]RYC66876.1 hypothetical protein EQG79_27630 [Spirosoma sordidisoli]